RIELDVAEAIERRVYLLQRRTSVRGTPSTNRDPKPARAGDGLYQDDCVSATTPQRTPPPGERLENHEDASFNAYCFHENLPDRRPVCFRNGGVRIRTTAPRASGPRATGSGAANPDADATPGGRSGRPDDEAHGG